MSKKKIKERQNPGWAIRMLELFSSLKEYVEGGDRVAVVLGVARLDVALERILVGFLTSKDKAQKELFSAGRVLSSFSAKIDLLFYLGLISNDFQKVLHLVRKIRNDAAHNHYPFSLDSESQTDRVNELQKLISPFFNFDEIAETFKLSKFKNDALSFRCALLALSFKLDDINRAVYKYKSGFNLGLLLNENDKFEMECPTELQRT